MNWLANERETKDYRITFWAIIKIILEQREFTERNTTLANPLPFFNFPFNQVLGMTWEFEQFNIVD